MEFSGERKLDQLAAEHTGLVKSVATKFAYAYGEDFDDLVQIGYIGLIKAIRGFDESRGFKFSTYAVPVIAGEIRSTLRDQGSIKVSRSIKADIGVLKKAEEDFVLKHNRSPRISELAAQTGLCEERVKQALQAQDAMKNMENYEDVNLITREEERTVERIDLKNSLSRLEKTERQVLLLRYYKDMTQSQVAKVLGISQVQVSRIERKTLKNMAKFMVLKQKNTGG